jgi:MOSC domain-containing protein
MRTTDQLRAGLAEVIVAPCQTGRVLAIAVRPEVDRREVVDKALIDVEAGVVGDTWRSRGSSSSADGSADPQAQVTVMNAWFARLIAGEEVDRWALAGDQLYVDFDLSTENIPPGTRLAVGDAVVEVSSVPHTGCLKFGDRFGTDAVRFVSTPLGKSMNLRGINTRVVAPGTVRRGDPIRRA